MAQSYAQKEEKPRIQPREVAEKAIQEMATIPPRLILYSILGALGLIFVVAIAVFFHVRSEDDGCHGSSAANQSGEPQLDLNFRSAIVPDCWRRRESKSRHRRSCGSCNRS